jgi:hypothetical protein
MSQVNFVCRVCNSRVEEKERTFKKSASMKAGCCSLPCFKKTKEYSEKRKEADRMRVEKIRAGGGFVESGTKSSLTRAKRFLEKIKFPIMVLARQKFLIYGGGNLGTGQVTVRRSSVAGWKSTAAPKIFEKQI